MARKSKKATDVGFQDYAPNKAYPCPADPHDRDSIARGVARLASASTVAATRVIAAADSGTEMGERLDIPALTKLMREQATAVQHGSLAEPEAMLMNQATALQALFARLVEKAMGAEYLPNFDAFMRMALRSQSQCRATLETLAAIKNPPIVYAKQANVTTGPQQINNGTAARTQARDIESEQTQLSEAKHELLPDTRASGDASRVNPTLETVGEIDRAKVPRG